MELNLSSFNTNRVEDMGGMFGGCSSLKELNLSSFNTNNVKCFSSMFNGCSSLTELNISNFTTRNLKSEFNTNWMFEDCSNELKQKIREQNKNIPKNAFD